MPEQYGAAIRRLLAEVIDSFEKLDIIVHLTRVGTSGATVDAMATALGIASRVLTESIAELAPTSAIRIDPGTNAWCIDPNSRWAPAVDALARLYEEDRLKVLDLMTRAALERVRAQAARAFADAFVLGSKKKDRDG